MKSTVIGLAAFLRCVDVRLIRVGVAVGRTFRRLAIGRSIGSDRQAASARDPVADGSARTVIAVEWHGGWELTPPAGADSMPGLLATSWLPTSVAML